MPALEEIFSGGFTDSFGAFDFALDPKQRLAMQFKFALRREPQRYSVRHAPPGGVDIQGKKFVGGEFIPGSDYANATPEQRRAIDAHTSVSGAGFVSPNEQESTDFDRAAADFHSDYTRKWVSELHGIIRGLHINAKVHAAIGDTQEYGTEVSAEIDFEGASDYDTMKYALALMGREHRQLSVLPFEDDEDGPDSLWSLDVKDSGENLRQVLSTVGVPFRTLIPLPNGSTRVVVFDPGTQLSEQVKRAGERYGAKPTRRRGKGEFFPAETKSRDESVAQYTAFINAYEQRHPERPRWGRPGELVRGRYSARSIDGLRLRSRFRQAERLWQLKTRYAEWVPSEHPRGQPDNAGQFRDKDSSAPGKQQGPEQTLVRSAGPVYGFSGKDREEHLKLKRRWAVANNALLKEVRSGTPNSPTAISKLEEMKEITKNMYRLKADPGGLEGIGLPGGPRDITIIGAGPGGMSAAVMAGTDGLDTLMVDAQDIPGGQSKFSSRIENYMGFPVGVTGEELAKNFFEQVQRVNVDTKLGVRAVGLSYDPATGMKRVKLSNGEEIESRAVIIAGGVEFRQMDIHGSGKQEICYGNGKKLAEIGKGKDVVVIGGSNGAAQAALGAADAGANRVYLLSRSPIEKAMSDYQVQQILGNDKIAVIRGEIGSLEPGKLLTKNNEEVPCEAVGVFVGGTPDLKWLPPEVEIKDGRVGVDQDLQTSIPGVYAVGDIRAGGLNRIAGAVGDGPQAERSVFQYFGKLKAGRK